MVILFSGKNLVGNVANSSLWAHTKQINFYNCLADKVFTLRYIRYNTFEFC